MHFASQIFDFSSIAFIQNDPQDRKHQIGSVTVDKWINRETSSECISDSELRTRRTQWIASSCSAPNSAFRGAPDFGSRPFRTPASGRLTTRAPQRNPHGLSEAVPNGRPSRRLCGIGSAAISLQNKSSLQIPFDFEWKEHYTLIVHFSRENTVVDQLAKSDRLRPGSAWTRASTTESLYFDYRIQCESGFYGADCMRQCRPAKNRICSLDGIPQCAPGWRGVLCREPVCESGCEHGKCIEPGKCICSSGFEGERCDQCISMKGCVHGSCSTPFGCDCEPGWGGTNCNTSTSICTRTRPCHNGHLPPSGISVSAASARPVSPGPRVPRR
ncbi:hypothetical protein L596_027928 [Steinernema carpocapsae]|uniref:EGF-like domain-containing protein n=1 Tax=Steinernema carpocapsae TaxID=34508 RepID=A0A4V5ZXQ4_STECR|nr:hypothetical protein L596_027928 [Steinernema carpocapsae]